MARKGLDCGLVGTAICLSAYILTELPHQHGHGTVSLGMSTGVVSLLSLCLLVQGVQHVFLGSLALRGVCGGRGGPSMMAGL